MPRNRDGSSAAGVSDALIGCRGGRAGGRKEGRKEGGAVTVSTAALV